MTALALALLMQAAAPTALEQGLAASREGRFEEAARLLERAVAEQPRYEALVALGVAQARLGRSRQAREALDRALVLDPHRAEALVESGGLRFQDRQYERAAADFGRALALREDPYTRRMRATARHLAGRADEALDDWNRLGEPRMAGLRLSELQHTRPRVVLRELAFAEGALLTRDQLRESRLRLSEVGVFAAVSLRPLPKGDGTAGVEAVVVERHGFGPPFMVGMRLAGDAVRRQVRLRYDNIGGAGVVVGALWKWEDTQPRVVVGLAWPRPFGLPFKLRLEAEHTRPTYRLDETFRMRARGVEARARRVLGPRTVGEAGLLTRDRTFSASRSDAAPGRLSGVVARVEHRLVDSRRQRLEVYGEGFRAIDNLASDIGTARGVVGVRYLGLVAGSDIDAPLPRASVAVRVTGGAGDANLPLDLMFTPGAASEMVWPLRGHRQKDDGVLGAAPIGPRMTLVNAEWRQRVWSRPVEIGLVAIYDGLQMTETAQGSPRRLHDAGLGLRLVYNGAVFRVDFCHSLTGDGHSAWTAGLGHVF